jgi:hypothetical protein
MIYDLLLMFGTVAASFLFHVVVYESTFDKPNKKRK